MRDSTLSYNIMEKHTDALVKVLKDFMVYILHSHVVSYVPTCALKDI
jgi:hypothetical protein